MNTTIRLYGFAIVFLFLLFTPLNVFAMASPALTSPTNGSSVSSSRMDWQAPEYQLYTGGSPYLIQVSQDNVFASPFRNTYLSNTNYTPTLSPGIWFWRVKAKDSSGTWSEWSPTWQFTLSSETLSSPSPNPSPSPSPTSSSEPIVSFTISNIPASINISDSFNVGVSLNNLTPGAGYFLKGAFIKDGSTNYFGKTKVNSSWIKNSASSSDQYPITTDANGNFSGQLTVMPDGEDSGYSGSGIYTFKLGRYGGGSSSVAWSNELSLNITGAVVIPSSEVKGSSPSPNPSPSVIPMPSATTSPKTESKLAGSIVANIKIPNLSATSEASIAGVATEAGEIINENPPSPVLNLQIISGSVILVLSLLLLLSFKFFHIL